MAPQFLEISNFPSLLVTTRLKSKTILKKSEIIKTSFLFFSSHRHTFLLLRRFFFFRHNSFFSATIISSYLRYVFCNSSLLSPWPKLSPPSKRHIFSFTARRNSGGSSSLCRVVSQLIFPRRDSSSLWPSCLSNALWNWHDKLESNNV